MKHYNVFDLFVVKQRIDDKDIYFICQKSFYDTTYREVFTKRKIIVPKHLESILVEELADYYSVLAVANYTTGTPAMLSKKELLQKMISINLLKQRLQLEKELQADKKKEYPAVLTRKYQ